jgi:hypothetical protein
MEVGKAGMMWHAFTLPAMVVTDSAKQIPASTEDADAAKGVAVKRVRYCSY